MLDYDNQSPAPANGNSFVLPVWASLVCKGIAATDCDGFVNTATFFRVDAGVALLRPEEPASIVYFISRGTIRVHVPGRSGSITLALLGPGDTIGEMAAIDGEGRAATATTVEPTELAGVSALAFLRFMHDVPAMAVNVLRLVTARLRRADTTIVSLASMEVDRRVARQLLAFGERYGCTDHVGGVRVPLRLTQQDLASLVGASRERTNRALVAFKRRGWISVDRQCHVTITRPDLLAKRVNSPY